MLGVAWPSGGSRTAPTSVQGASTQGCEVPVFTGTTGRPPLHPYRGHPHRDARFPSSRERRGDRPYIRTQGASTQGCEVPVFTGTTGRPPPFTLILTFSPQGRRDLTSAQGGTLTLTLSQRERGFPRLRGERRRWFAKTTYAANVMAGAAAQWGSCRLDWRYVGGGVAFGRFANRPYIRTGGIHTGMRGSRLHGNDGATAPTSVQGASTQGCEVPVFTGTTGRPPLHPHRGHPHRDARFPSSRERRGRSPRSPSS